jgi:hypothetical protein
MPSRGPRCGRLPRFGTGTLSAGAKSQRRVPPRLEREIGGAETQEAIGESEPRARGHTCLAHDGSDGARPPLAGLRLATLPIARTATQTRVTHLVLGDLRKDLAQGRVLSARARLGCLHGGDGLADAPLED